MHMTLSTPCLPDTLTTPRLGTRPDAGDIESAVRAHCRRIRCNASNTVAAINTALRAGGDTLSAIRAGKVRADQLHFRSITHPIKA